ncbi:immunoglobulin-like domain-containing protein [Bacillus sp. AFS041924]|uniref:immunoglobulin-like domain-containing protein n=1 Tax=Bacillus sp. AFS041924 TaxID=2033503 RepID=UPI000BFCA015|nr:immunoglobulin-like domain-containing protein [Bacillus sp. AFS041924]PGS49898.1 hypothetical protein COC46_14205 [Bacillus sp. AFS041924]
MKNKLYLQKRTLLSILISSILLINTIVVPVAFAEDLESMKQIISKTVTPQSTKTSMFNQGGGYQTGKYDLNAIQPTATNWTRQTRLLLGIDPKVGWSTNIGNGNYSGYGYSSPVISADGTIYVRSASGFFKAIDKSGVVKWSITTGADRGASPVIAEDGTIYLGATGKNGVYAVNPDGTEKFFTETDSGIESSPSIGNDGTIYALDKLGTLVAISPYGMKKWTFSDSGNQFNPSSPVIGKEGNVYFVKGGSLYSVTSKGEFNWKIILRYNDVSFSTPTIGADGTIYLVNNFGEFYAVNPDGSRKWVTGLENTIQSPNSPVIAADGTIYIYDNTKLYAYQSDATVKWSIPVRVNSLPILGKDGTIYLNATVPSAHLNSRATATEAFNSKGEYLWSISLGDSVPFDLPLAINNEAFYVYASDGYLYSFTTTDVIAPDVPIVDEVTDQSLSITGKAEPGSTMTVTTKQTNIASGITKQDGTYSIPINYLKAGTQLTFVATDAAGNSSDATKIIVKDVTSPTTPTVNEVTDLTTNISGEAEPGSIINVKSGQEILGKTITNENGSFTVLIDKQKAGTKLFVTSTDDSGNVSEATEIIVKDTTKPVINGVKDVTINIGEIFDTLKGVTAEDGLDGNLTDYIRVIGTIDNSRPNTSTLTYIVTDKSGNKTTLSRKITVIDNIKPVILGGTTKSIAINSIFDPYNSVYAYDNVDNDLTENMKVSGTLDTKKRGEYTLTYTVSDKSGNTTAVIRKITVYDNVKPIITGATSKTIVIGASFNAKAGVFATDNVDGSLTNIIKISGSINTKAKGTYTLTYSVSDTSGNVTTVIRKITVIDNIKPVITGATNKTIKLNSTFNPRTGVTAKDNVDGDLTKSIVITGSVNTKKRGTYNLTYTVSDKSGNKTIITRKITVS